MPDGHSAQDLAGAAFEDSSAFASEREPASCCADDSIWLDQFDIAETAIAIWRKLARFRLVRIVRNLRAMFELTETADRRICDETTESLPLEERHSAG